MTVPARPVPDLAAAEAVAVLMDEVAAGKLTGEAMAQQAADRCAAMFGNVAGPGDPLWEVHVAVARQVLGFAGIPVAELAQWLSVARNRENPANSVNCTPEPDSATVGDSGPQGDAELSPGMPDVVSHVEPERVESDMPTVAGESDAPSEPQTAVMSRYVPSRVTLPDGRTISASSIAARGRNLPRDDGLRPL